MNWGPHIRPTRAIVNLSAVVSNAHRLSERAGCPLFAVVKADAYGHGACAVAAALESAANASPGLLRGLAVSLVEEGIELRESGIHLPILVMGPSLMEAHGLLVQHRLTPMVSDVRHLGPLAVAAQGAEQRLGIHLMVDTGMGRLGIHAKALSQVLATVAASSALQLEGIASHLACADTDDPADDQCMSSQQLKRFEDVVGQCEREVPHALAFHIANSAAILRFPGAAYDLARPGLAMYGNGAPAEEGLVQALSVLSEVSQIRHIARGETVSYGAHWTAPCDSMVAIVPVGYADGLPRNLTGKGAALIAGTRCPIRGAISMDMIVVDITKLPNVHLGNEVVVLGQQGGQCITVAEVANLSGISEYEVSCGISKRVPRCYVEQDV